MKNVQTKGEPMLEAVLQALVSVVHVSDCRDIQKVFLLEENSSSFSNTFLEKVSRDFRSG